MVVTPKPNTIVRTGVIAISGTLRSAIASGIPSRSRSGQTDAERVPSDEAEDRLTRRLRERGRDGPGVVRQRLCDDDRLRQEERGHREEHRGGLPDEDERNDRDRVAERAGGLAESGHLRTPLTALQPANVRWSSATMR